MFNTRWKGHCNTFIPSLHLVSFCQPCTPQNPLDAHSLFTPNKWYVCDLIPSNYSQHNSVISFTLHRSTDWLDHSKLFCMTLWGQTWTAVLILQSLLSPSLACYSCHSSSLRELSLCNLNAQRWDCHRWRYCRSFDVTSYTQWNWHSKYEPSLFYL